MIGFSDQLFKESRRARERGALVRGRAIATQIEAGFILCAAVIQSLRLGDFVTAKRATDKVGHSVQTIRRHLDEPQHVPLQMLPTLWADLERLEIQLAAIEAELGINP